MKKLLSLFLVGFMLLSLFACGKEPAESSTSTEPTVPSSSARETSSAVPTQSEPTTDTVIITDTAPATDTAATDTKAKTETTTEIVPVTREEHHYVGVGDQGHRRICIYDLDVGDLNDPKALIWEYTNCLCAGLKFRHSDYYDTDVLIWCGESVAEMVDLKTKKVLYRTEWAGENVHSQELLPDGTLLVTATNGKTMKAFDTKDPKKNSAIWSCDLGFDGHGCLYDPDTGLVWVAGADKIVGYIVSSTGAKKMGGCTYKLPQSGVHDLSPVYGDNGFVWVTCNEGVLKVSLEEGTYTKEYPMQDVVGKTTYTPGFGNWRDGSYAWDYPDGKADGWTTSKLSYLPVNEKLEYGKRQIQISSSDRYYKCRVFCTDYQ